ncbi:hypothetical protein QE435_004859 [Rhizobium sp. SORGH_AS 787]|nr:hypothetical protein [Rhizobium sp. SORGH_AS_0787]
MRKAVRLIRPLLRLHIISNILLRHQAGLVTPGGETPDQVVSTAARLHSNRASWDLADNL